MREQTNPPPHPPLPPPFSPPQPPPPHLHPRDKYVMDKMDMRQVLCFTLEGVILSHRSLS